MKAEVAEVTDEVAAESVVQVADRDGESTPLSRRPPKPISSGNNRATSRARRQPRTRSTPKLHRPRPRSRQRWLRGTRRNRARGARRRRPSPIRPSRMNWRSPDLGTTLLSRTAFDGKTISARDAAVGGGFDGVDNDDPRRHCLVAGAGLNRPPIGRPLPQPERCADEVPGHKMATGWNGNQPNPDALTSQTTKPSRLASPAGSIFFATRTRTRRRGAASDARPPHEYLSVPLFRHVRNTGLRRRRWSLCPAKRDNSVSAGQRPPPIPHSRDQLGNKTAGQAAVAESRAHRVSPGAVTHVRVVAVRCARPSVRTNLSQLRK